MTLAARAIALLQSGDISLPDEVREFLRDVASAWGRRPLNVDASLMHAPSNEHEPYLVSHVNALSGHPTGLEIRSSPAGDRIDAVAILLCSREYDHSFMHRGELFHRQSIDALVEYLVRHRDARGPT